MRSRLGYPIRQDLYPGEDSFFQGRPEVTGMAAEDNSIILNPYSGLRPEESDAVALNEALRLYMRNNNFQPNLTLTPQQKSFFQGTEYEGAPEARNTILSRILTNDPSAGQTTLRQRKEADRLTRLIQEAGYNL
jgi:hypothetical protein